MKRNIFLLLAFVVISCMSQQKVYTTQKGETLRDVAKKFDIGYRDLIKANPKVSRWPKANTEVVIPHQKFDQNIKNRHPVDPIPDTKKRLRIKLPVKKKDSTKAADETVMVHEPQVHLVEPKETLYGLSKKYGVTITEIVKMNPILVQEGLKIGQELKVPKAKKEEAVMSSSRSHIVKPKETLFGLSQYYGITITDLVAQNAFVKDRGLKIGDTIKILEKISTVTATTQKAITPKENYHQVLKGETLYSISKKYGISVTDLTKINDSLKVNDLEVGALLQLPTKRVFSNKETPVALFAQKYVLDSVQRGGDLDVLMEKHQISKDSLYLLNPNLNQISVKGGIVKVGVSEASTLFAENTAFIDEFGIQDTINVMLMLPFDFKKIDTLSKENLFSKSKSLPGIVADFYMGAQMAIDSLSAQTNINLKVVDTERSQDKIAEKIDILKLFHPDVIVGPLFSSNVPYVAKAFKDIPLFYPIYSSKQNNLTQKNIVKTATHKELFKEQMIDYIKTYRGDEHLLIVGDYEKEEELNRYKKILVKQDSLGNEIKDDISILTADEKGYISPKDFLKYIQLETPNWVFIVSDNTAVNASVINNAKSIPTEIGTGKDEDDDGEEDEKEIGETPVRLFAFEKSDYLNDVAYEEMATYKFTYATDRLEYNAYDDEVFKSNYVQLNNAYPSKYAIRGFAVTYDAICRIIKYKLESPDALGGSHRAGLSFLYLKGGEEHLENQSVYINSIQQSEEGALQIVRMR